ncbi:S-adenosylmethionine tRNA ribosyltransferase [Arachidicoccus ginsenosidimutans]|uniref:S-adenosylmethionine:tRNA ribosyltransferase-isomerase n=1 Tax=Arachidicoccus sp. BS20 TaxID=1850526 RepID=UPI0007F130BA|nr:S-adenosylmethionine:tRNA ribosyltransferase-isomerase [Arachidicoccus sp. BS20]ANI89216.1 S-adenosylmethionine tRNA ribosyltransferase [Arachidicoccus sp. BS20]
MHPKHLSINDFTYDLSDEKIAKFPLQKRDESKLLIYESGKIEQSVYKNLPEFLSENTLLVFNNTKVVEARLLFKNINGANIELFCLEPADDYSDITTAMLQKGKVFWKCLVGNAKKWKEDLLEKTISSGGKSFILQVRKVEKQNDYFLIEFLWNIDEYSFAEVLHFAGQIPLPPYLHREAEEKDKETYQTVYAKHDGSVAAPTAGLHFTENLLQQLKNKNIQTDFVTLHVGAGTFKPVKSDTMEAHEMHAEFIDVSVELINSLIDNLSGKIVSVGTTSLRTLESLYWLGVKVLSNIFPLEISQWEVYDLPQNISASDALNALKNYLGKNEQQRLLTKTQIIIAPNYELRIANGLITNFHQPKSTLLLLVAAFIGDDWKNVYDYALQNDFRFLSYGDGSLLWRK